MYRAATCWPITRFIDRASEFLFVPVNEQIEPCVQGRVFAVRRMIAWFTLPFACMIAGPLGDKVFSPLPSLAGRSRER